MYLASIGVLPVPKSHDWIEKDGGVICFSVTSDGTTGPEWMMRLKNSNNRLGVKVGTILRLEDFKPTKGVTTRIEVLKGQLFSDSDRYMPVIRAEAERRGLSIPNAEIACLIREKFSNEEMEFMGLSSIVVMHEPIRDFGSVGGDLLYSHSCDYGPFLHSRACWDDYYWFRRDGFAFAAGK